MKRKLLCFMLLLFTVGITAGYGVTYSDDGVSTVKVKDLDSGEAILIPDKYKTSQWTRLEITTLVSGSYIKSYAYLSQSQVLTITSFFKPGSYFHFTDLYLNDARFTDRANQGRIPDNFLKNSAKLQKLELSGIYTHVGVSAFE